MPDRAAVTQCVYAVIDELNDELAAEARIAKSLDTPLVGRAGKLDSLGVVSLMFSLERAVEDDLKTEITLSDRLLQTEGDDPLATVGRLIDFVTQLVEERRRAA